jgi:hypothetical protein
MEQLVELTPQYFAWTKSLSKFKIQLKHLSSLELKKNCTYFFLSGVVFSQKNTFITGF